MAKAKQIFLFLVPTLIVAIVFIVPNQQNVFAADDLDIDEVIAKAEPGKNLHNDIFYSVFYALLPDENFAAGLLASGNVQINIFLLAFAGRLCVTRNHSPPASFS